MVMRNAGTGSLRFPVPANISGENMSQTLSRKQAAEALGISVKTLMRRVAKGVYQCERIGEGQFSAAVFMYAGIGLPEPPEPPPVPPAAVAPHPKDEPQSDSKPAPESERQLGECEQRILADIQFAEAYLKGRATDSLGNKIDGTNAKWPIKGAQTLIGCKSAYPEKRVPRSSTAHMDPRLLSDYVDPYFPPLIPPEGMGKSKSGFMRNGEPLAKGYTQEQYDADMENWRRSGGGLSEGQKAERLSKRAIEAAFPQEDFGGPK